MKKIIKIMILLMLLYLPNKVFAASITVSCPSSVTVGDTITCTVTGNHSSLAGLKGSVSYSGMEYKSVSNLTGSNMFVVSNATLDGAFDIANTSKSLARYTFKATSAGTAKFNVKCEEIIDGNDFSSISCTGVNKTITIKNKTVVETPVVPKNNDATLKGINLSSGELNFDKNKDNYDLEVNYSVDKIDVKGILNDNKASYKIEGNTNLIVGNNIIKINVTAEDGKTKKTYTLNIKRKDKVLSTNNKVKNIVVSNYDINFNESIKEYELLISNETSLTINVELEDQFARYEILDNKNLVDGSVITIKAIAEDDSTNIFKINIIKEKNLTEPLFIGLGVSIFINLILIILLIKRR